MNDQQPVNVLCLKWGRKYGPEYVNRLHRAVVRNLSRPFRFVCVTDDGEGIEPGVEVVPMPPNPDVQGRPWPNLHAKLCLFRPGFAQLSGPTLFLDVDLLVTGPLDDFFDYRPGDFCIIHNWIERRKLFFRKRPDIGNSSCFRFDAGSESARRVWECFLRDKGDRSLWNPFFECGSQKYQTRAMREAGNISWWPDEWVSSFKRHCIPPFPLNLLLTPKFRTGGRIMAFHGRPDIDEAIVGYRGKGVKIHLSCRPTPWLRDFWEV